MNNAFTYSLFLVLLLPLSLLGQDSIAVKQLLQEARAANSPSDSYQKYLLAYSRSRQTNYEEGLKKSLPFLAKWELEQNQTAAALRYLLEELDLLKKEHAIERVIEIEKTIGDIYAAERLFAESLPYYKLVNQKINSQATEAKAQMLEKIGDTYAALSQPDSAFFYYAQLPAWGKMRGEDLNEQLNILHKIVNAYHKAGKYGQALSFNERILEHMETAQKPSSELFIAINNLGYNHNFLKNYEQSIDYFRQAVSLCPTNDFEALATLYTNIGIANFNLGNYREAIDALTKANENLEKIDKTTNSSIHHLLSNVYFKLNDTYNALLYNKTAIQNAQQNQAIELLSDAHYTAAQIHISLFEYETALNSYQKHLVLRDSLKQIERQRQQDLLQDRLTLEKADKEIKLLLINQEVQNLTIQQLSLEKEKQVLALDKLQLEKDQQQKALALLQQEQAVKEAQIKN